MKKVPYLFLLLLILHINLIAQSNYIGPGIALQNDGATGKYIDLGDVFNTLDFPVTFEAWIKPESVPPSLYGIFTTENDNSVYSGLWIRFTSIKGIEFEIGDGLGNGPGYRRGFRTTTTMELSKWTHIAIVANSITDVKFYFNGQEVNQVPSDGSSAVTNMVSSPYTASIAHHLNYFSDLSFDGSMDEIRLWNISRTENEIRDNMCKKITNPPSGLIGYWNIDESYTSTSVLDYAPPSEDGIVIGQMNKITSGAPIGDESKYLYTSNWSGIEIGLGSSTGDSLSISSMNNSTNGMQVYRVDLPPYNVTGLSCPTPYYFGAFAISSNNNSTYNSTYYYDFGNGIINASNEDQATLFKHEDASTLTWVNSNAILNAGLDNLEKENENYRAEYILNVPLILQVSDDTTICAGDSVQLLASGASSYIWSPSAGLSCTNCDNPIASPSITTSYILTAMNGTCSKSDTITITVISSLISTVTPDTSLCQGDSIQLFVSGGSNYTWSPSTGLSCTNCNNPFANPVTSINYTIVASSGICSDTATTYVQVDTMPLLIISDDTTICEGDQVQIMASGANSYLWDPVTGLSCFDCANPYASPLVTTTYTVVGYQGACSNTALLTISVGELNIDAGESQIIGEGSFAQLNGSGAETYSWSPGNSLNDSTTAMPIASPLQTTTYTLTGTGNGCQKNDTVTIIVVDPCNYIMIPSAFSPNNDGVNDQLKILSIGDFQLKYFKIFNRWGELIFESTDSFIGWDGTFKGTFQEIGTYIYILSFGCKGIEQMKQGNVTLLR